MYLLDTNVISELRRPRPHGAVVAWLEANRDAGIFLSSVTIGELHAGIENLRVRDGQRAIEIETWLDSVVRTFDVLSVDAGTFASMRA